MTTRGRGEAVLVVDDDEMLREMLVEELRDRGYEVVGATDANAAMAEVRARPDLSAVLSDIRMPRMSGTELAAAIARERPGLPVVLMSGYPGKWATNRVIAKPFRMSEVEDVLREAMGLDQEAGA